VLTLREAWSGDPRNGKARSGEAALENERMEKLIGELTVANDSLKMHWREGEDDSRRLMLLED
jgi:hypothetical protein